MLQLASSKRRSVSALAFERICRLSSRPPRPRKPAAHSSSVAVVLITECVMKVRLFIEDHEEMEGCAYEQGIEQHYGSLEHEGPPQDHGQDADVHGVTSIPVEPADHEPFGCIDRSRCSPPEGCEVPHTPDVDHSARGEDGKRERHSPSRSERATLDDQPGHVDGHRTWHYYGEE